MKARFTDSMNWLHTWAGLVVGWVLFAVFLTGTLAYFQHEISRWMQPELPAPASTEQAILDAQRYLTQHAPHAESWSIVLPGERGLTTNLSWRPAPTATEQQQKLERISLDANGEPAMARETRGGRFLYRFHFDLHYLPVIWARWLVGFCTMLMLLALISGIVVHKKIFKDFFTLQWFKGHKSWLDAHTVTSVLSLPFHLMITYTGLITLMYLYMSVAISNHYDNNRDFRNALTSVNPTVTASGVAATLPALTLLANAAQQQLQGAQLRSITVYHPADLAAVVEFRQGPGNTVTSGSKLLRYKAHSEQLLLEQVPNTMPEQIRQTLVNLHAGRFANPLLRWLYFLSGLVGTAMIGTGLLLWSARRQVKAKKNQLGQKLVHALNGATLLGLPFAVAGYFWANRLLPFDWPARAAAEINVFFLCWLLMLVYSLVRPAKRLWYEGLLLLAVAFLLLPLVDVLTTQQHLTLRLAQGEWLFVVMDLSLLGTGLLCWQSARILARRQLGTANTLPLNTAGRA